MKAIKYTSILNSFVSQEGFGGNYTNYIYYSVLVKYYDGTSEIVEGQSGNIAPLLAFLRTPQDEIEALRNDVKDLKASMQHSETDIGDIIDQKMTYVIDTLYPIPNVIGMKESEGITAITNSGLIPVVINKENRSIIDNRAISKCVRNSRNFKVIELTLSYKVPDVVGLPMLDAVEKLQHAGLVPTVNQVIRTNVEDGVDLSCTRKSEQALEVELEVSKRIEISSHENSDKATAQKAVGSEGQNSNSLNAKLKDENTAEIIEGLRYATNLFSVISVRRQIEELYRKTGSDVIKYILDQPNETIKEVGKQILTQLEG